MLPSQRFAYPQAEPPASSLIITFEEEEEAARRGLPPGLQGNSFLPGQLRSSVLPPQHPGVGLLAPQQQAPQRPALIQRVPIPPQQLLGPSDGLEALRAQVRLLGCL